MYTYRLIQLTCSITLFARGWLSYRFDHPLRGILWDESLIAPIIQRLWGIEWTEYHANSDAWITPLIKGLGVVWMVAALLPWFVDPINIRKRKISACALVSVGISLVLDAYCRYNESTHLAILPEYALQALCPILVCIWAWWPDRMTTWSRIAMVAAGLTFVGHGLFAIGFYPVPGHFVSMTMDLLGCSEPFARKFLWCAGALDLVTACLIWVPKTRLVGLGYMVFWGTATTAARPLTMVDPAQSDYGLSLASGEMLVRTAHWCIPLILLIVYWPQRPNKT